MKKGESGSGNFKASLSAFFAALSLTASACLLQACSEAASTTKPQLPPPASVEICPLKLTPFLEKTEFIGTMKSRKSITLYPHVEGHITQIMIKAGENVKAGSPIIQIDSREQSANASSFEAAAESVQADLASAQKSLASLESSLSSKVANVEFTNAQHKRYQNLATQGAVAQSELDSWRNNYQSAVAERDSVKHQIEGQKMTVQKFERNYKQAMANLTAQKEQLRYYKISAPFAGTIGDIPVKIGDHVDSQTALCTLTENHPLEVYISVPAETASQLKAGTSVSLLADNGSSFGESKVSFIAPLVDPASQTVLVKAIFPNTKSQLRAEQTVKAVLVSDKKMVISVPTSAVLQTAGKHFVFLSKRDAKGQYYASEQEIDSYAIDGGAFQVKTGLQAGDKLITTGIQRLVDGAPISPKLAESESAKIEAANTGTSTSKDANARDARARDASARDTSARDASAGSASARDTSARDASAGSASALDARAVDRKSRVARKR